jgi:hypothetical protein
MKMEALLISTTDRTFDFCLSRGYYIAKFSHLGTVMTKQIIGGNINGMGLIKL